LLFLLLWWYSKKPRAVGAVSAAFLLGYGGFRFFAEFARAPDAFLGFQALGMTRGQWLCVPMILFGVYLLWRSELSNKINGSPPARGQGK
ncbi:MAG: prolipoprotein diacylglyceryl transferase, partial [Rhodocyclaceae bacterium]|nr:prolipoprotein diacylglyceryl transferase [Rhodocyclaceae bacterium]